jgi:predicted transcriptional regulator
MEEKYILFSMEDERLKDLSEALSNHSCKKIINLLSEKELTETDIARELNVPLNTIDYNIKKLVSTGLIEKTSHFWSIRGKKMPVYRLSNKKIIISPKKSISIRSLLISIIGTGLISWIMREYSLRKSSKEIIVQETLLKSQDSIFSATAIEEGGREIISNVTQIGFFAPWQWFLFGAWLGIIIFFSITFFNERRSNNGKIS